jgi:DNA-binding beta-propeller fold protein YncE
MLGGERACGPGARWVRRILAGVETRSGARSGRIVQGGLLVGRKRWLLAFSLAVAISVADGGSAFALPQRGHVFAFSFGSQGSGQGQFQQPSAVAVNEATGDLYVADYRDNRVEVFESVLGARGELAGERFAREFAVPAPIALAADNTPEAGVGSDPSAGDVYVVSNSENREGEARDSIYKFSAAGARVATLTKFKVKGEEGLKFEHLDGVTVSASGQLYVYGEAGEEEERVFVFDHAVENVGELSFEPSVSGFFANGIALDGEGDLYLADRSANPHAYGPDEGRADVVGKYEKATSETLAHEAGEQLIEELDPEQTTSVAVNTSDEPNNDVDELNDVYIANVNTPGSGQPTSTVAAFTPSGSLIQRFSAPGLKEASGVAVWDKTGDVFVTDRAEGKVYVFGLQTPTAPSVSDLSSCQSSQGSPCAKEGGDVRLNAQVDADGGGETSAYFEYGTASCAEVSSQCNKTATANLPGSFSDQPISAEAKGLEPGTYHYRVVAQNALGTSESTEATFTIVNALGGLPDARAWELVSPPEKHGATLEPLTREGGVILASEDGDALTYVTTGAAVSEEAQGNGARDHRSDHLPACRCADPAGGLRAPEL